jgi:hypothetical protein
VLHINKENCGKGIVGRVFDLLVEFRDLREGQKHKKNISADREGQKEGPKVTPEVPERSMYGIVGSIINLSHAFCFALPNL